MREYEHGQARSQRELVQLAIVDLLAPLARGAPSGFLEAIEPIAFDVTERDDASIELLEHHLNGRSPAVAVAVLGAERQAGAVAPGVRLAALTVEIYHYTTHRRGMVEGRAVEDVASIANRARDPGVYAQLELVWGALADRTLGIPWVHALEWHRERHMITDPEHTLWCQEWRVIVERNVNWTKGLTQRLTEMVATLRPTGNEPDGKHIVVQTDV